MKEELFQLIDGDLPDDSAAELLHMLSVDPDKRATFRQQLKLQEALHHNGDHGSLTPGEETEMVDRLTHAIGIGKGSSQKAFGPGLLALVALLSLGAGSGIGYLSGRPAASQEGAMPPPRQTIQHLEQPQPAAPPAVAATPIDRDAIIASIRDSIATAFHDSLAKTQVVAKAEPRQFTHSKAFRRIPQSTIDDDPTGAKKAKELTRKAAKHKSSKQ